MTRRSYLYVYIRGFFDCNDWNISQQSVRLQLNGRHVITWVHLLISVMSDV